MADEEILDSHCFLTLFQRLFDETVSKKKIIPEVEFNLSEGTYPEIGEPISKRGWRRLASPRHEVAKAMIRDFYANVGRTDEQMARLEQHPYTSRVRGKKIDFTPKNIRKVMRFKEETPGAQYNYHHRRPTEEELNLILRELCEEGATWKMGKGKDPKPIQLRRPELTNLARGWLEFVIHNLLPTGNKSEITVARAMLIHSIIRGDEIRAEEIIAGQIILITQGLGGKGKIAFPSTIYKLCKAAKVKMNREYGGYEECDEGRFITNEVMETIRIPHIALGWHVEQDNEDEPMHQFVPPPMPHNVADDAEFGDQEQDQNQQYEHHWEQPPYVEPFPQLEQPPPQYQHQQQPHKYQQKQMEAQQQGFQKLNEQVANMQIGIQTKLGHYKEEVHTLKDKQQELFTNTNNLCNHILRQQEMMNKEMIDLKKWQVSETVGRNEQSNKIMEAWNE
ncbi:hypothetical protein PIB30_081858 [Stylosanthes scabra]|uniref:Putative plant transposon protein domain-containing protein n=1 Tax=Stylosanthes scabra TaxID=79078 RepID=A0ABU6RS00_9FABA|nr:hypothetical protein [Stylosanthes scabra]